MVINPDYIEVCTLNTHEKLSRYVQLKTSNSNSAPNVFKDIFKINSVVGKSYNVEIKSPTELSFNKEPETIEGGIITVMSLDVSPLFNNSSPIKHLTYSGISPVRKGDIIVASIPRFQKEYQEDIKDNEEKIVSPKLKERQLSMNEKAIAIEILDDSGDLLREDRSFDYYHYTAL